MGNQSFPCTNLKNSYLPPFNSLYCQYLELVASTCCIIIKYKNKTSNQNEIQLYYSMWISVESQLLIM